MLICKRISRRWFIWFNQFLIFQTLKTLILTTSDHCILRVCTLSKLSVSSHDPSLLLFLLENIWSSLGIKILNLDVRIAQFLLSLFVSILISHGKFRRWLIFATLRLLTRLLISVLFVSQHLSTSCMTAPVFDHFPSYIFWILVIRNKIDLILV